MQDRYRLSSTLAIGVAGTVAVLLLYGRYRGWPMPLDASMGSTAGLALLHGHLSTVYSTSHLYELPLSLPFTGFVGGIPHWFHLRAGPTVVVWTDAVYLLVCFPLILVARGLAWDLGLRRRLVLLQLVIFFLAAVPEVQWGHPEDVMALALSIQAIRSVLNGRDLTAAVYLSLAISSKQWSMMLVPLVVVAAPQGRRLRTFVASAAAPVALATVFLVANVHSAFTAFAAPANSADGNPGHPWISPDWLGAHTSQVNRAAAVILAVYVTWRCRRLLKDPLTLVVLTAFVLALRPLTETVNFSYYWTPALTLAVIAAMVAHPCRRFLTWLPAIGAMAWAIPKSYNTNPYLWWVGMIFLLAVIALQLPSSSTESTPSEENGRARSLTAAAGR